MPELFMYSFMQRALLAGLLLAIFVPLIGSFLVARRYSLISDSLAHVSLAGVGAGMLFGFTPTIVAIPVAVSGALAIEWLRQSGRMSGEVSLAVLMSGGLALAITFASLASGASANFESYLFGSIATTTVNDLIILGVTVVIASVIIAANYRALVHIAFDEDSARIAGYKVSLLNYLLVAIAAILVVLSLRITGGLLISALLVLPVITAAKLSNSFGQTIILAVIAAVIAVVGGLATAFYADIPAGAAIALSSLALFIIALIWKK